MAAWTCRGPVGGSGAYLGFVAIGVGYVTWFAAVAGLPAGSVALSIVRAQRAVRFLGVVVARQRDWLAIVIGSVLVVIGLITRCRGKGADSNASGKTWCSSSS